MVLAMTLRYMPLHVTPVHRGPCWWIIVVYCERLFMLVIVLSDRWRSAASKRKGPEVEGVVVGSQASLQEGH